MDEARRSVPASPTAADQAPTPHAPRAHEDRWVISSLEAMGEVRRVILE
jgi:hypothetical protein